MAFDPGRKNRKIVIQSRVATNNLGDVVTTWATLATVWAEERPYRLRTAEAFQAAALHSLRVSTFVIWYRDDVLPEMHISYAGLDWRITSVLELGFKEELEITAEVVY